jgi:hypothetical protein
LDKSKNKAIRLLSIGTGEKKFKKLPNSTNFNNYYFIKNIEEFMMNTDISTADYLLS